MANCYIRYRRVRCVGWTKRSVPNKKQINTAGGSPAASHLLLLRQKKVTEEKATPVCRPSGSLRCSGDRKSPSPTARALRAHATGLTHALNLRICYSAMSRNTCKVSLPFLIDMYSKLRHFYQIRVCILGSDSIARPYKALIVDVLLPY